ncbi:MAG TPA: geranylgeranylglyceryl/heptaprenylglyceryl phosphate synthase [Thermoplasmatales archaeon]|nr:geranylgeranylglyceryl/heptaprenylglyceryl phosphate synthase [Thermoplasmatales archaeon]
MQVAAYIIEELTKYPLHFALIDPDKQDVEKAGHLASIAEKAGSSVIMVGGSTIASQQQVDETVKAIKQECNLPVVLFPSAAKFLSRYADAIFFMSLLNSRKLDYVIREHVKGSLIVKRFNLEPISMGYIIVEPGMTAGRVGEADLIKRDDYETAVGYALAAQYLGMSLVYLEAGSGASQAVPNRMITDVKEMIDIPLIVGGGIRDAATAKEKVLAGADIIVTGTALEEKGDPDKTLSDIVKKIRSCRRT